MYHQKIKKHNFRFSQQYPFPISEQLMYNEKWGQIYSDRIYTTLLVEEGGERIPNRTQISKKDSGF